MHISAESRIICKVFDTFPYKMKQRNVLGLGVIDNQAQLVNVEIKVCKQDFPQKGQGNNVYLKYLLRIHCTQLPAASLFSCDQHLTTAVRLQQKCTVDAHLMFQIGIVNLALLSKGLIGLEFRTKMNNIVKTTTQPQHNPKTT